MADDGVFNSFDQTSQSGERELEAEEDLDLEDENSVEQGQAVINDLLEMVEEERDPNYVPSLSPRKSARIKARGRGDYNPSRRERNCNRIWEEREKKSFLMGLKKYGSKNWKQVASCVSTKTPDVVKSWIEREKMKQSFVLERRVVKPDGKVEVLMDGMKKSRKIGDVLEEPTEDFNTPDQRENITIEETLVRPKPENPTDKWLQMIEDDAEKEEKKRESAGLGKAPNCDNIIPMSLRWIAEFEKHPDPGSCRGVDYAAIYRYFANLSEGEVPPDLNPVTALRVTRLLTDLGVLVATDPLKKETQYLENYRGSYTRYRTADNFDANSKSAKMLGDLSRVPGLNPLDLHLELFTQRNIDSKRLAVVVKEEDPLIDVP
ncbi:uncharacterized protein LOC111714803 [Eurytemora carolleeae]|uniref:uncharacterized protein LOC111714803 n=1 Tax=Eurytemora carolleeae TaxID=1294199 RepID=UPI000C758CC2|nr:uncharacterized protein LOC111714803 [Eurytemora carolleeae]|eukprot:XP_023345774.1 uncharacterized protein LOC111714803 [Eurytemora affinis]